jgi:hypothetical protein
VEFGTLDQLLMRHSAFVRCGRGKWQLTGTIHDRFVRGFGRSIAQCSHFCGIPMHVIGQITVYLKETCIKVHIIECLSCVLYSELSETTSPTHFEGSSWPLKIDPIGCRETPVTTTLCNVPEERRSRIRSTLLPNSLSQGKNGGVFHLAEPFEWNSLCLPRLKTTEIHSLFEGIVEVGPKAVYVFGIRNSYRNSDNILSCKCLQPKSFGREICWIDPSSNLTLMAKRKLLPVPGIELVTYPVRSF